MCVDPGATPGRNTRRHSLSVVSQPVSQLQAPPDPLSPSLPPIAAMPVPESVQKKQATAEKNAKWERNVAHKAKVKRKKLRE